MSQLTMFGVPPERQSSYVAYHDESGTDSHHDRFLFQGVLFVPSSRLKYSLELLRHARSGYKGRIHFVDLRDNTSSQRGEASWNWLNVFFGEICNFAFYKCMVADRRSPAEIMKKYTDETRLYNYTTMLAIYSGITWSLSKLDRLELAIYSEDRTRTEQDNFTTYVPGQVSHRCLGKRNRTGKCPRIIISPPSITTVPGDPSRVKADQADHCEFIQLVDLITSGVAQAINASARQNIKVEMAYFQASWLKDIRKAPWEQAMNLHRIFSVSCFPDRAGGFFDVPLGIEKREQERLFE